MIWQQENLIYYNDFTNSEHDYEELANNVTNQLGRLDGMIHCAAMLGGPTLFAQSDTDTWSRKMDGVRAAANRLNDDLDWATRNREVVVTTRNITGSLLP